MLILAGAAGVQAAGLAHSCLFLCAQPHSPDNRDLARNCRDKKIDRVYIGSCTGGKTEDFLAAATLLHAAGEQVKVPTFLVPATQKVSADPPACPSSWLCFLLTAGPHALSFVELIGILLPI